MKFYQFFANVDAASFGVNDEHRIEIIQAFLTSDYEEEEEAIINFQGDILEKKRKRRGKNEYSHSDREQSLFSKKYLDPSNEEEMLDEDSRCGKKFRLRFRVPYQLFQI